MTDCKVTPKLEKLKAESGELIYSPPSSPALGLDPTLSQITEFVKCHPKLKGVVNTHSGGKSRRTKRMMLEEIAEILKLEEGGCSSDVKDEKARRSPPPDIRRCLFEGEVEKDFMDKTVMEEIDEHDEISIDRETTIPHTPQPASKDESTSTPTDSVGYVLKKKTMAVKSSSGSAFADRNMPRPPSVKKAPTSPQEQESSKSPIKTQKKDIEDATSSIQTKPPRTSPLSWLLFFSCALFVCGAASIVYSHYYVDEHCTTREIAPPELEHVWNEFKRWVLVASERAQQDLHKVSNWDWS
ncbi:hypothetical protein PROFUN_01564 [Planoprotostelium fungivorum]|uniref:Uncharacterized protein n=1 Tax=Planoprotostelium fungivorum TaxID=1890364 RepID=A0A2P6NTL0_9EUKA|nr:hypothetical protein PROFUN_01564 [Planoprotostelium fungivorum]